MLIVQDEPKSASAEAYRRLRTNIIYSSFDESIRSIMITSAYPEEGKTTLVANIALSFAEIDKRVMVIDCDMRKPGIHTMFKISNRIGISEIIQGYVDLNGAVEFYSPNVHILNSGNALGNPLKALSSKRMEMLMEELRERYDYIFIDAPPVLSFADAKVLAEMVDGVILLAAYGESEREDLVRATEEIRSVKGNIIGTVANKMK